ncbi:MAG TPA: type IV secretory system conjugative DNA transfer family protein [Sphingomonas sp.]
MTAALPIPAIALEDSGIALGKRGSGKSNTLQVLLEHELDAGHRAVMIDPKGDRWGIRLDPDKSPSRFADFPVFGGKHGDYPVTAAMGEQLGRIVAEHRVSCLIDLSLLSIGDKQAFMMGFAPVLLTENRAPLTLFVEEVHQFANIDLKYQPPMLVHHMANFNTLGRTQGIVLWCASQRPAQVNATLRSQNDTVIAHKVTSPLDREAVRDWLKGAGRDIARRIEDEAGSLDKGEAFVWVSEANFFERVQFPRATTYDSGRTPKHGETLDQVALPPLSGSAIAELLAAADPGQKAGKPESQNFDGKEQAELIAQLRAADRELQAELAELREADSAFDRQVGGLVAIGALVDAVTQGRPWSLRVGNLPEMRSDGAPEHRSGPPNRATTSARGDKAAPKVEDASLEVAPVSPLPSDASERSAEKIAKAAAPRGGNGAPPLNRTALDLASLFRAIAPDGLAWDDALLACGRRPNSGDSRLARKGLVENGLIEIRAGECFAAKPLIAREDIGFGNWPAPRELLELWAEKLRGPGGDMLRDLFTNGPADNAELGRRLGKSPTSGWWRQGRRDLLRSNLVRERDGKLHLHPLLEPERADGGES